jgi:hypothetical protein
MNDATTLEVDWRQVGLDLDLEGYAVLQGAVPSSRIDELVASFDERSPVGDAASCARRPEAGSVMEQMPPLPVVLEDLAREIHGHLASISGRWRAVMAGSASAPSHFTDRQSSRASDEPPIAQVILSCLSDGEHEVLAQSDVGEHGFLIEAALLMSRPGVDFAGGEFVMTEQRPRMQSRPIVVPLDRGDVVVFAAAMRPLRGSKGFHGVDMKHAISRVRSGRRLGATILFRAPMVGPGR